MDRTEPRDLVVIDDKIEYTKKEVNEMLIRIDLGNRQSKSSSGFSRTISAFGIMGIIY